MVRRLSSEGKSGLSSHEDACWTSEQNTCNNGESVCAGDQREATGRSPCSTQEDVFQLPAEVSEASEGAPVEPRLLRLRDFCVRALQNAFASFSRILRRILAITASLKATRFFLDHKQLKLVGIALLILLALRLRRYRLTDWNSRRRLWSPKKVPGAPLSVLGSKYQGPSKSLDTSSAGSPRSLFTWPATRRAFSGVPEISFSEVLELVSADAVEEVHYSSGSRLLLLLKDRRQFASTLVPGADASFFRAVAARVPRFRFVRAASVSEAVSFVFPVVLLCLWWRMLRSLIDSSRGSKDTGTDRGLEVSPPLTAFSDVVSRQKHELLEVVSLLNGECRYAAMGARLPRGVLLVGPSGTGKTLLARAVAGEARVPFLSAAASEFVEVFVGQGARRVREVFQAARRRAPCVLFIDELDALGNRLSPWGTLSGHEEYVQTVNQFLMEMDGVCGGSLGVVVIGATNRLEAIDPALLRSGRFDRHIHLQLPSAQERHEILKLHARSKKLRLVREAWAHLQLVGDAAEGLSGADLENLLNESIFRAVRRGREAVDPQALDEALLALLQRAERQNIPCS
ncbi:hypothetical protein cyc_07961 [Cyclospora cayetanensis]|uniref:AAA+ ATPase domain-containing protein n=1 Tax=Cyclospora cayetanensis TaxID=88456 RepID=A0A1D3CR49_9EIME|nr:hypothetical protein cyc_07961 [Cyclospora cayetanensis]